MLKLRLSSLALVAGLFVSVGHAGPFADAILNYTSGSGFAAGFTNATAALGEPSRVTPGQFGGPVDPFNPPYLDTQIVSVGTGGSLTVQFDSPIFDRPGNPFGLDLIIFGNNGFTITNNDYSGGGITDGSLFTFDPPGSSHVFVSLDNVNYFELVAPPGTAPTVDGLFPTDGSGDFQLPVNPALSNSDFAGRNLNGIRSLYASSGGGTGFDLAWAQTSGGQSVVLGSIRFVRIEVVSGKAEIDAFAAVPEPAPWTLALLGLLSLAAIHICRVRIQRTHPLPLPGGELKRQTQLPSSYLLSVVGTSRCDVPARAAAGGTNQGSVHAKACAAERGADGAARHPYHYAKQIPLFWKPWKWVAIPRRKPESLQRVIGL